MVRTLERQPPDSVGRQVGRRETTRTTLHWPLLSASVLVLSAVVALAYFRYTSQIENSVTALLDRADQLENEAEWHEAAKYMFRYLRFRPTDEDVSARLAVNYAKSASTYAEKARAIELYNRALSLLNRSDEEPAQTKRVEIARLLADLFIELGRFAEAEKVAADEFSDTPQSQRIKAIARYRQSLVGDLRSRETALNELEDALEKLPADAELASYAARLIRDELKHLRGGQEKADGLMDTAVEAEMNKNNSDAFLARYVYRTRYDLPGAGDDLQKAIELGPDSFRVLLAAGAAAMRQAQLAAGRRGTEEAEAQLQRAAEYFERSIQVEPTRMQGYVRLGQVRLLQGTVHEACAIWRKGINNVKGESLDLNRRLADALISQKRLEEAERIIYEKLMPTIKHFANRHGVSAKVTSLLRARVEVLVAKLHLEKQQPLEAISLLSGRLRMLDNTTLNPQQLGANLETLDVLSRAYTTLGRFHLAAKTCDRLLELAPRSARYLLVAAEAWTRAGDASRATELYRSAVSLPNVPRTVWLRIAEGELRIQQSLPLDQQNWDRYHFAFRQASEALPKAWQLQLLAARQVLTSRGQRGRAAAAEHLATAETLAREDPILWRRLALQYERMERSADADRALNHYAAITPDATEHQLLRSRLLQMRGNYDEASRLVDDLSAATSPERRSSFLWEAVRLNLRADKPDAAKNALLELYQARPFDTRVVVPLIELSLRANDLQQAERWEEELHAVEGDDGVQWRYLRTRRLLLDKSSSLDDSAEASQLIQGILSSRPDWHLGHVLHGDFLVEEDRFDEAIEAYERAISLGARGVSLYEQLVRLLFQRGRFLEADSYLARLKNSVRSPGNLPVSSNSLSVSLATQLDQLPEAQRRARRWVDEQPNEPTARIWLGHVLAISNMAEEAEQVLIEATKLAESDVRTWNALFSFYLGRDDEAARKTLDRLGKKSELSPSQLGVIVARGHELLNDFGRAEQLYREVVRLDPDNDQARLRLAALLSREDVQAAEIVVRELLELRPESGPARRLLAALRAAQGGEGAWDEVEELLGATDEDGSRAKIDRRLEGRLHARFGGQGNLQKAREALEPIVLQNDAAAPMDRALLARVCEAQGDLDAARLQHLALVKQAGTDPRHLANFIGFLLRQQDTRTSARPLNELDRMTASGSRRQRFLFIVLKARWLHTVGRRSMIVPLVEQYVTSQEPTVENVRTNRQLVSQVGGLYLSLGMHAKAEPWLRKLVSLNRQAYPSLVTTLCHLSRHDEAVDLCLANKPESVSSAFLTTLSIVLTTNNPPSSVFQKAEPVLQEAVDDHDGDAQTLFVLGSIRVVQERYDEAVELFAKANEIRPGHVLTLNNIATLLAEFPGQEEQALKYVEQAIGILGEKPFLLDTKGIILVKRGDIQQAVKLLRQATSLQSADPRFYLHLAVACERSGEAAEAHMAMSKALSGGVESSILTKSDKRMLGELRKKLGA